MEYTVGSLADLISGTNTPDKPKVVKKQFIKNEKVDSTNGIDKKPKLKDAVKKKKSETGNSVEYELVKKTKKLKKRKADDLPDSTDDVKIIKKKKRRVDSADSENERSSENYQNLEQCDLPDSTGVKKTKKKKSKLNKNSDIADSDDMKSSENLQNAKRRVEKAIEKKKKVYSEEDTARTIFVGNVPIKTGKKVLKEHFRKYGPIESLRFRGIPVADPKTAKKVAAIKKEFHPDRNSILCYIRFANQEDAIKAEAENGALLQGHHLRVHSCNSEQKPDETKAIFVGNLPFNAEEEELWKLFETCGPISHVRIVRDSRTGMGKGFAYINFKDSDSVQLALEMENVMLKNRELRIALSNLDTAKKNRKRNKSKSVTKPGTLAKKPFNKNKQFIKKENQYKEISGGDDKSNQQSIENSGFQGKFSDKKKKYKVNKGALEKKKKMKKIAPHAK
nr:RNA-binding protein 34 [Leptinotarsa decemlineata]